MKTSTLFLTMFVVFLTISVSAQETIWLDADGGITTKEQAIFYRTTPQKKDGGFWVVEYYKNGSKQREGFSKSNAAAKVVFEGDVVYYHPNGKPYIETTYTNGKLNGKHLVYYVTGNLKEQGRYVNGKQEGVWKAYYANGKIKTRGKYRNGEKVGVWRTFYKNDY